MPLPVRIEAEVWDDWRFECLAGHCGYSHYEAIGRMAKLWAAASDRMTDVMPDGAVRTFLGPNGPESIIASDLGERVEGGIRIKGAHRFEPLWNERRRRRDAARSGGQARAGAPRDEKGRIVADTTDVQPASHPPATHQPPTSHPEATHSPPFLVSGSGFGSQTKIPETQNCAARAARGSGRSKAKGADPAASTDHARVVAAWDEGFREANEGNAPSWGDKPGAIVKRLREKHGADEVIRRMRILFSGQGPAWVGVRGVDIASFANHFDKLAAPQQRAGPARHASHDLLEWQLRRVQEAEDAEEHGEEFPQ